MTTMMLRAGYDRISGFGRDSVDLALCLERAGVDVYPWPMGGMIPGLPRTFTDLLTKDPTQAKPDVAMTFAPPFDIHPDEFADLAPVAVGYSMWEKSKLTPDDMLGHGWPGESFRGRWWLEPGRELDAMIVTCDMNVPAFQALEPGLHCPVVPCGIEPDHWPIIERKPGVDGPMRFAMNGMLNGRKDPFLMLQAWRELKEEYPDFDAVLELHTLCPGLHPKIMEWIPDVIIHERAWSEAKLLDWYHSCDVLVSVSRGEGNNKPAMEMLATGATVIASDWSGHDNWLRPGHAYALPGTLLPAATPPGTPQRHDVLDFRVDKDVLKATILHCWSHPDEVAAKGLAGAAWIREHLSWDVVAGRMIDVLADLGVPRP